MLANWYSVDLMILYTFHELINPFKIFNNAVLYLTTMEILVQPHGRQYNFDYLSYRNLDPTRSVHNDT